MKVLNLVTTPRPFFIDQVNILESKGIETTTLIVPGRRNQREDRSITDYIRFYPKVLRQSLNSYDLIHANFGLTAPMAICQPKRPIVLSLWGTDLAGKFGNVSSISARFFDDVIVMSGEMKEKLGCEARLIPHGVDMDKFRPMDTTEMKKDVSWNISNYHIIFPYDPSREVKNYSLAERVVEEANKKISTKIELHAVYNLSHETVPKYMNAADALLITSKREGFPNSVKEAMACNLPIVSTNVGDLNERIHPVKNSFTCDSFDEIVSRLIYVLQSGSRSNGRDYIKDLNLDSMGDNIINVYDDVLGGV